MAQDGDGGLVRRRTLLIVGAVVAAAYVGGAVVAGIGDALAELTGAALVPVLGAVACHVVVTLLWPQVHRASVRAVGDRIRYREALTVSMSSFTLSHTMPGGGAVGATVAVNRLTSYGLTGPAATASVTLTGLLSVVTIAGLGVAGVVGAVVTGDLPGIASVFALAALVVLLAVVVGIVVFLRSPRAGDRLIGWIGRLPKVGDQVDGWRSSLRGVTEDPPTLGQLARIVGWSTGKWLADIASLALLFVAFGQTPRLTILLVGFAVSQLAAAIPITPGGVGFVEGGMVAAFVALGAPASFATTVVLAYRLIETWMPTVAGVPLLVRPTTAEDEEGDDVDDVDDGEPAGSDG